MSTQVPCRRAGLTPGLHGEPRLRLINERDATVDRVLALVTAAAAHRTRRWRPTLPSQPFTQPPPLPRSHCSPDRSLAVQRGRPLGRVHEVVDPEQRMAVRLGHVCPRAEGVTGADAVVTILVGRPQIEQIHLANLEAHPTQRRVGARHELDGPRGASLKKDQTRAAQTAGLDTKALGVHAGHHRTRR